MSVKKKKHVFHQANLLLLLFQQEKTKKDQNLNSFPSIYPTRLHSIFSCFNVLFHRPGVETVVHCSSTAGKWCRSRRIMCPKGGGFRFWNDQEPKNMRKSNKGDSPKKNKQAKKQTNKQPSKQASKLTK